MVQLGSACIIKCRAKWRRIGQGSGTSARYNRSDRSFRSWEPAGMPSDPFAMPDEPGIFLATEWSGEIQQAQVLVQLGPVGRRGQDNGDRRRLEHEAIPIGRRRDEEPRRVVRRRLEQGTPSQR